MYTTPGKVDLKNIRLNRIEWLLFNAKLARDDDEVRFILEQHAEFHFVLAH